MLTLPALPPAAGTSQDQIVAVLLLSQGTNAALTRSELQSLTGYWHTKHISRVLDEMAIPFVLSGRRGDFPRVSRSFYLLRALGYQHSATPTLEEQHPRLDFMRKHR